MPAHGEEPLRAVDLYVAFPAVGYLASNYDVESGTGRGELSVAVEVTDYLKSPQRYLAIFINTLVYVDACVRVCAREHEAQPCILAVLVGFQGFLKCVPRE